MNKTISFMMALGSIFLAGCSGSHSLSLSTWPTTPLQPEAPTASITASPMSLTYPGSATITWSTTNASDVTIDPIGPVNPSGSQSVNPTQTTTYNLTAKGAGGTAKASVIVTVTLAPPKEISCWGDSLTSGNQDLTGVTYPTALASLSGMTVNNEGVAAQLSTQIAVRMNAYSGSPQQQFTSSFVVPAAGTVNIPYFVTNYAPVSKDSPASGVKIAIGSDPQVTGSVAFAGGAYIFTPSPYPTTSVSVPFEAAWTVDTGTLLSGLNVIWAGRNNAYDPATVKADIAAMVAALPSPRRFLILSVLNDASVQERKGTSLYNTITRLNADLAAQYPDNYLDIRSWLVSQYDPINTQDVIDFGNDQVPSSLRYDTVHLNAKGYQLMAQRIFSWLQNAKYL